MGLEDKEQGLDTAFAGAGAGLYQFACRAGNQETGKSVLNNSVYKRIKRQIVGWEQQA